MTGGMCRHFVALATLCGASRELRGSRDDLAWGSMPRPSPAPSYVLAHRMLHRTRRLRNTSDADAVSAPAVRERLARFIHEVEQCRDKLRQNLTYADEFLALLPRQ